MAARGTSPGARTSVKSCRSAGVGPQSVAQGSVLPRVAAEASARTLTDSNRVVLRSR